MDAEKGGQHEAIDHLIIAIIHSSLPWEQILREETQCSFFFCFVFCLFVFAKPMACRSSRARDQANATAVTTPDP